MTLTMDFIAPKEESHYIKVIGVGGGGTNAVNHMFSEGIKDVDFIVCNTDSKSLATSPVVNKIQLGEGLGAGGRPEVAKEYAEEATDRIKESLAGTRMLFITAGMGGGTGTGASPVIADIAKSIETNDPHMPSVLVVAIVTMPFNFEGIARLEQAQEGLNQLRDKVDSIIIIDNNKVFTGERIKFSQCFAKADDVLLTAAKSVAEMITVNSYMNVDLRDVDSVMSQSGTAIMGAGIASGENRAIEAVQQAMESPLLNNIDITDSQKILLHITCSTEYEVDDEEISEITGKITQTCKNSPNLKMGVGYDESLGESLRVILVATGFQLSTENNQLTREKEVKDFFRDKQRKELNDKLEESVSEVPGKEQVADSPSKDSIFEVCPKQPQADAQPANTVQVQQQPAVERKPERTVIQMDDSEQQAAEQQTETIEIEPEPFTPDFELKPKEVQQADVEVVAQTKVEPAPAAAPVPTSKPAPAPTHVMSQSDIENRELQSEVYERMAKIKKMKQQVSTLAGLSRYEEIPAYQREGMNLDFGVESDHSNTAVDNNGNIIPNSYINKQVD